MTSSQLDRDIADFDKLNSSTTPQYRPKIAYFRQKTTKTKKFDRFFIDIAALTWYI